MITITTKAMIFKYDGHISILSSEDRIYISARSVSYYDPDDLMLGTGYAALVHDCFLTEHVISITGE